MNNVIQMNSEEQISEQSPITTSTKNSLDEILNIGIKSIGNETIDRGLQRNLEAIRGGLSESNKEIFKGTYLIPIENNRGGAKPTDYIGINDAYILLSKNPDEKILLASWFPASHFQKINDKEFQFVMAHPNVQFIQIPIKKQGIDALKNPDDGYSKNYLLLTDDLARGHMSHIKHGLQGIKDLYHPQDESEKARINHAFEETKKYFPGLDTLDKMLDFVAHVKIDIPEKMKGEKIAGVYCDVDGTLIEYVGIHSGKEGTQALRMSVVNTLKKYEAEGKEIIIRTGGNVEKKAAYLRSLGITRPVVNKYDYAGATAEIVIDDTDQNAFILQSKILPETYIDTKDRE